MKQSLTSAYGYRTERAHRKKTIQPPCVSCRHQARCADERLACRDYVNYLQTGRQRSRDRAPSRELFIKAEGDPT